MAAVAIDSEIAVVGNSYTLAQAQPGTSADTNPFAELALSTRESLPAASATPPEVDARANALLEIGSDIGSAAGDLVTELIGRDPEVHLPSAPFPTIEDLLPALELKNDYTAGAHQGPVINYATEPLSGFSFSHAVEVEGQFPKLEAERSDGPGTSIPAGQFALAQGNSAPAERLDANASDVIGFVGSRVGPKAIAA